MSRLLRFALCCSFVVTLPAMAFADEPARPSFVNDIEPILTRYGCNQGACHGKGAGQNGFRLSLRGYAPELDHGWIVKEQEGRRVSLVVPDDSLLLRKALGQVPHGGGKVISPESKAHHILLAWLQAGAPGSVKDAATIQSVAISTGNRVMKVGEKLQLTVMASYSDGSSRDVTWLTQFASNDAGLVEVDADGKVKVLRSGETAIRAHYQGQVAVVVVTVPYVRSSQVPSPPSAGERARVRGPMENTAANNIKPIQQGSLRNDAPANSKAPLTLTLSPQSRGEGTGNAALQRQNNFIDEHVFAKLVALNIPESRLAPDEMFLRRVYLDTIGTLPTEDEVRAFVADARGDKRAKVIDELLQRPEFADLWTMLLADLFQNRKERDHDVRGTKGVRAFHQWLREQVVTNRPWNELARAVLTSQGNTDEHPEIGYYVVTIGEFRQAQQSDVVASVAQAFLGTRIGCAKCHNHPLEKYTQDDYYHFAAFFSRVAFERKNPQAEATELLQATEHQHNQLRGLAHVQRLLVAKEVTPKPEKEEDQKKLDQELDGLRKQIEGLKKEIETIGNSPVTVQQPRTNQQLQAQPLDRAELVIAPGSDPRVALADWMTSGRNESFNGSIVNRIWQHFLGVGLVEPVDDLRASNPPTNPALWKALNADFVSHGFDLRHLMRTILNSRTYQLSSESLTDNEADTKFYSHYYARRLPAELLLDAISQATAIPDQFPGYPEGVRAQQLPDPALDSYFLRLFGRSDRVTACACERTGDVTMSQLLHLQNGDTITRKLEASESRLAELLKSTPDNATLIERLFLTTLARQPTETETNAALNALASGDPRDTVFRDLLWALLNSKEFAFNH